MFKHVGDRTFLVLRLPGRRTKFPSLQQRSVSCTPSLIRKLPVMAVSGGRRFIAWTRGNFAARPFVSLGILLVVAYVLYQIPERLIRAATLKREAQEDSVYPVATVKPKPSTGQEAITLPGNIEAWYQAPIYAQVSGYVRMWYKDYGATVVKGDILAEIEAPALDAQYQQAQADMMATKARNELASLTAKRYSAMKSSHAVSEQVISVKEAAARAERAQFGAAQHLVDSFGAQLRFKQIVAPYDGVVISRDINVGDYINKEGNISQSEGKSNLFTVADIHKMRLFVSVPERLGVFLKPGLTATVILPQYKKRQYTAQFVAVARGFDPDTRTAITEFSIENNDQSIWPGSYAMVTLSVPADKDLLTIPSTALVFAEAGAQVAIVSADNKVHFKDIKIDKVLGNTLQIFEGVSVTDSLIDSPSAALLEGDTVRVVSAAPGYTEEF